MDVASIGHWAGSYGCSHLKWCFNTVSNAHMAIHFKITIKQILEHCSLVDGPYSKSSVTLHGYSRYFIEGG